MDQVIVTSGSQDGLNLICRLVDRQKHPIFIENPCYQGAAYLFQSIASELCPIPVDDNGLVVDKLPRERPGVLFVTPSHQYPTGATLSLQRRLYLLRWAEETNSVIIEDDYDSDFRYDGPPLTALAGLDRSNCVLYLGTFSKSLGAGLRLGYAVVPAELAKSARVVKSQMNSGQAWLEQAVLAEFLTSGFLIAISGEPGMFTKHDGTVLGLPWSVTLAPLNFSGRTQGCMLFGDCPRGLLRRTSLSAPLGEKYWRICAS